MVKPDDAAFSRPAGQGDGYANPSEFGLTIRQYFAAQAMIGILASGTAYHPELVAEQALKNADALISALNKPQ